MRKILFIATIFIFISCHNESKIITPKFTEFIYIKFNLRENMSLKFNGSDTLYIQRRFREENLGNYVVKLDNADRDSLISKINNLHFEKVKASYIENRIEDGTSQAFILNNKKKTKSIYIHGRIGPKNIRDLGDWLINFIRKQNFVKTKEYIHFWSIENIVPPPPPPKLDKVSFKNNNH